MDLSDEQMHAVGHGRDVPISWRQVDLPVGPQPLPCWARGLSVDWHDKYANAPSYSIKASTDLRTWPDKRFVREGRRYMAVSPDGRAEVYYHGGAVGLTKLRRFRRPDGTLTQYRNHLPQTAPGVMPAMEPGEWVDVEMLATTQQEGFGGSHIHLAMADGSEIVLRGPWHGGSPNGFVECSYSVVGERWGGRSGLFITHDLFKRMFARFQAHLQLLEVTVESRVWLQAIKPEWDCPKDVWMQRERQAQLRRCLAVLGTSQEPVGAVWDRDDDLAPWALSELTRSKLAAQVSGGWKDGKYIITEAGRVALSKGFA